MYKPTYKQGKACDCINTIHGWQIIGSYARPNPDCKKCHGTGIIQEQ